MRDLGRFVWALAREWAALVTGGVMIAVLFLLEDVWRVAVPRSVAPVIAGVAFLAAAYRVWGKDQAGRLADQKRIRELEEDLDREDRLSMHVSDDEFWLLGQVARHGLRRQSHAMRPGAGRSASINAFFIGDTPIDYTGSRWFYDLANKALQRGLLLPERGDIYRLSPEGRGALSAGTRKGRLVAQPEGLIDGRTGEAIDLSGDGAN